MLSRPLRLSLFVIAALQAVFALGCIFGWRFITELWPLPYTNTTTFLFIGSIAAAATASTLWCLLTREDGALAGVFVDYVAIFIPTAIFTFQISANSATLRTFSLVAVGMAVFGAVMLWRTIRIPIRDPRPLPQPVRAAFMVFIVALLIVGGSMVLKMPNVLPWDIPLSGQILYGWMFLGAASYFTYGLLRPSWHNAAGQLAGFLAYDLVLVVPFLLMLPTVAPQKLPNLLIYLAVLISSGLLATFYLFINPATRMRRAEA
jgi:hypothetical protein